MTSASAAAEGTTTAPAVAERVSHSSSGSWGRPQLRWGQRWSVGMAAAREELTPTAAIHARRRSKKPEDRIKNRHGPACRMLQKDEGAKGEAYL
uniref:Uncharacterized protein n=2 Tax=Oryza TaxID=4527 RepID=Q2QPW8_ORYSJ|nr:hypothetical protein LOC_Os12g33030 [Oryza sativa Japonica Group]